MENIEEKLKEKEEQLFKIQQEINQIRSQHSIQKEVEKVILDNLENNVLNDVFSKEYEGFSPEGMFKIYILYFKINNKPYNVEVRLNDFEMLIRKADEVLSEKLLQEMIKIMNK